MNKKRFINKLTILDTVMYYKLVQKQNKITYFYKRRNS